MLKDTFNKIFKLSTWFNKKSQYYSFGKYNKIRSGIRNVCAKLVSGKSFVLFITPLELLDDSENKFFLFFNHCPHNYFIKA